jgi:hypothetical protein
MNPNPQNKSKPLWRLIVGVLVVGAVANSLGRSGTWGRDWTEAIIFLVLNLLLAAWGVWLVVSYLRKPRR